MIRVLSVRDAMPSYRDETSIGLLKSARFRSPNSSRYQSRHIASAQWISSSLGDARGPSFFLRTVSSNRKRFLFACASYCRSPLSDMKAPHGPTKTSWLRGDQHDEGIALAADWETEPGGSGIHCTATLGHWFHSRGSAAHEYTVRDRPAFASQWRRARAGQITNRESLGCRQYRLSNYVKSQQSFAVNQVAFLKAEGNKPAIICQTLHFII
jgi:hypothetical protein